MRIDGLIILCDLSSSSLRATRSKPSTENRWLCIMACWSGLLGHRMAMSLILNSHTQQHFRSIYLDSLTFSMLRWLPKVAAVSIAQSSWNRFRLSANSSVFSLLFLFVTAIINADLTNSKYTWRRNHTLHYLTKAKGEIESLNRHSHTTQEAWKRNWSMFILSPQLKSGDEHLSKSHLVQFESPA